MTLECIIQYQAHTYNLVFYIILIFKKKKVLSSQAQNDTYQHKSYVTCKFFLSFFKLKKKTLNTKT